MSASARVITIAGRNRRLFGWKPEPLERRDPRDRFFSPKPRALAPEFDLEALSAIPVFDQLEVGDCVENAICLVASFVVWKSTGKVVTFSRLFGYALGRLFEGVPLTEDSGLYIPDAFKSLRKDGLCYEATWPYGQGSDRFQIMPTQEAIAEALNHQGLFYYRCPSVHSIKEALLRGWPVVFGTQVPSDLTDDGEFRLPANGAGFDGGHCMAVKGWSDTKRLADGSIGAFRVRNSWGEDYHAEDCAPGECWVSYQLFDRGYASDAIVLASIEIPEAA